MDNSYKDSKYLSFLLRHHPEKANLHMDSSGYVKVAEIIENTAGRFTESYLSLIVETDEKSRYSYNSSGDKIRANQGHSIEGINPGLLELEPPEILYHGTSRKNLIAILDSQQIKPMDRAKVHLSADEKTAYAVGRRRDDMPVILEIAAHDAYRENRKFCISENGVWLTDEIDIKYIKDIKYTK